MEDGGHAGVDGQTFLATDTKVTEGLVQGREVLDVIEDGVLEGALGGVGLTGAVGGEASLALLAAEVLRAAVTQVLRGR